MPQWMKKNRCRKCSEERAVRFCLRNNKEIGWRCCNEMRSDEKCPAACVYALKNVSEQTGIPQLKTDSRTELIDFWDKYLHRWAYKPVNDFAGISASEMSTNAAGKQRLKEWLGGFSFPDTEILASIYQKLELGKMPILSGEAEKLGTGIANSGAQQITNLCCNVEVMATEYMDAVIAQDWTAVIAKHTLYKEFALGDVSENYISVLSRHPLLKKVTRQAIVNAGFSEDRQQAFVLLELNNKESWTMVYAIHNKHWHPYQHIWGTIQDYYAQKQHFKDIVAALATGNLTISWDKLSKLSDRYPLNADMAYYRGLYYNLEQKPGKARLGFEDSVAFDPTWEQPLHHLALSFMQDKDFETPIKYLEQILKFHPQDCDAMNNLGVCYMGMEQLEKASEIWRKALELEPNKEMIKMNLDKING